MKFISPILSVILIGFIAGCQGLLNLTGDGPLFVQSPTTQPLTARDRVENLQRDLDTAWQAARLSRALGAISDSQFKVLETNYPAAQSALNLALVAVDEQPKDLNTILKDAADAVEAFKARSDAKG